MSCSSCPLKMDGSKQCHEYTDVEILQHYSVMGFRRFVSECPCRTCLVKIMCKSDDIKDCYQINQFFQNLTDNSG